VEKESKKWIRHFENKLAYDLWSVYKWRILPAKIRGKAQHNT
jgi:hypothetical protein